MRFTAFAVSGFATIFTITVQGASLRSFPTTTWDRFEPLDDGLELTQVMVDAELMAKWEIVA